MISNKFQYGLIDLSYILSRNIFSISRNKKAGEYTEGELIRSIIQTLNKVSRDYGVTCDKFVFFADKWSKDYDGYIRSWMLKEHLKYKGSRTYMNQWLYNQIASDPNSTPEEIEKAAAELYLNQVKQRTKKIILEEFDTIGLPAFYVDGWEADDLVWLSACLLYGKTNGKPSVIITKDSDQQYCTTPELSYFKIPTAGSSPEIITYDDMYNKIPQVLRDRGVSLYTYHSFLDSLGEGHNDLGKTSKGKINTTEAILRILDGNFQDVADPELFKLQMETFDISRFPGFKEAQDIILNKLQYKGHKCSLSEFQSFCSKYGVTNISDRYFTDFSGRFDEKLFSE